MTDLPRRFRVNVATNYLGTATAIVVALVVTPVLVHGLGKVEYGIWVLVGSTVLYLDLFNLGFSRATVKYVAEQHAAGDLERVRRTIATSFLLLSVPAAAALAVSVGIAFGFPHLFGVPHRLATASTVLVILIGADLVISIPGDTFGGTLVALQRYDLLNATLIAVTIAQAAAWTIVLEAGGGLIALGVVTVALSLAGQVARYLLARRLIPGISISRRLFDRSFVRPLASLSGWIAVFEMARVVIARMDTIVVGLVVGIPAAAVYAVGQKLALLAGRMVQPAIQTFFPHAAELAARGEELALRRMIRSGTRISFGIALPVALVLMVLAGPAVRAWVGPKFDDATLVVVFLAGGTLVSAMTEAGVHVLRGAGEARRPGMIVVLEAVLNLTLSVVLGIALGIKGVALATLAAAATVHLGLLLPYLCRRFGVSVRSLLASIARAHLPAAGAALAVGWLIRRDDLEGLVQVTGAGAAILATYLVAFVLTGLAADERRRLLARVRQQFSVG
jgi:O-antigen/teichoic acid export membrane protein